MSTREGISPVWIAAGIVALVAAGLLIYFLFFRAEPAPPPTEMPTVAAPPPAPAPSPTPPPPSFEVPALGASDEIVRGLVGEVSKHPEILEFLTTDRLIRRFVAAVANVAHGQSPRPHVGFLAPEESFEIEKARDGRVVIAEESYERYDLLVDAFTSLDNEGAARLYHDLSPLFEEAYAELGNPDTFEEALSKAINRLLAVPVPDGEIEVFRAIRTYRFADPELEDLTPAEKHLLRMGPENAEEVQAKLLLIKMAMALTMNDGK